MEDRAGSLHASGFTQDPARLAVDGMSTRRLAWTRSPCALARGARILARMRRFAARHPAMSLCLHIGAVASLALSSSACESDGGRASARREPSSRSAASSSASARVSASLQLSASAPAATGAGASGPPSAIAPVPKGADTHGFAECKSLVHFDGAALQMEQLGLLAASITKGLCYGYFAPEVTANKLEASFKACASAAKSTAFELSMTLEKGTCSVIVGAGAWGARTFVRTVESYATEVEVGGGGKSFGVGSKWNAFELVSGKLEPFFSGQPCAALDDPKETPIGEISPAARKAWSTMPSGLRSWLCQ